MSISGDETFDVLIKDKVFNPLNSPGIISSKNVDDWRNIVPMRQFPGRISKATIPIDFSYYQMAVVTKVEAGVTVAWHYHEEPVFRYITDGNLNINNIDYGPGDWVLVPPRTPYQVMTSRGYIVLAAYGAQCGTPHDFAVTKTG